MMKKYCMCFLAIFLIVTVSMSGTAFAAGGWSGNYTVTPNDDGSLTVSGTGTYGKMIGYSDKCYLNGFELSLTIPEYNMEFYGLILGPNKNSYITSAGVISFLLRPQGENMILHVNTYNTVITNEIIVPKSQDNVYLIKLDIDENVSKILVDINGVKEEIDNENYNYKVLHRGVYPVLGCNGGTENQESAFTMIINSFNPGEVPDNLGEIHYGCYLTEEDENIQKLYQASVVD